MPNWLKGVFVWTTIAVTAVLVAYQYQKRSSYWERHINNVMQPMMISPAPTLSGDLEALFETAQLKDDKRPVLYHFWATWCAPCRAEIPTLNALSKRFADKVRVVTISADQNKDDVLRFFAGSQPHFAVLWDKTQKLPDEWGVQRFPESYLITADGKRVYRFSGPRDWNSPEAIDYLSLVI